MLIFIIYDCSNGQKDYFIDKRQNCNNVYDATSNKYVRLLGIYNSTNECINACLLNGSYPNDECQS